MSLPYYPDQHHMESKATTKLKDLDPKITALLKILKNDQTTFTLAVDCLIKYRKSIKEAHGIQDELDQIKYYSYITETEKQETKRRLTNIGDQLGEQERFYILSITPLLADTNELLAASQLKVDKLTTQLEEKEKEIQILRQERIKNNELVENMQLLMKEGVVKK